MRVRVLWAARVQQRESYEIPSMEQCRQVSLASCQTSMKASLAHSSASRQPARCLQTETCMKMSVWGQARMCTLFLLQKCKVIKSNQTTAVPFCSCCHKKKNLVADLFLHLPTQNCPKDWISLPDYSDWQPSPASGKWLTKDKTFGPDRGIGILKPLQDQILEVLVIRVAFEQVSLQRLLHFPGKQAEIPWELLKEYLQETSLPVCWYSLYNKASCCCHCAVKAGVNPPLLLS